ncbi:MAG: hypothetical protein JO179_04445 [Solirubrobacterales bacterium]|nr:hypothetical protein [Solirubrobacterales bacterium]
MGHLPRSTDERASEAAWSLGHDWLGPEHLLLALVASPSIVGEALRACELDYEQLKHGIDRLPPNYHGNRWAASDIDRWPLLVRPSAQIVIARAQGIAIGMDSCTIGEDHLLLALLWEQQTCFTVTILKRADNTRERILEELDRRGVRLPDVPLPMLPDWGPWFPVTEDEYLPLLRDLRRSGKLFRTSSKEGRHCVSIAQSPH